MEIKFNSEISSVSRATGTAAKSGQVTPAGQEAAFDNTDALNQALATTPDIRPDEVARVKSVFSDEHYPPLEMMHKIACLLAVRTDDQD